MNGIEGNNIERLEEGWFFHDHAWQLLHIILKEIRDCEYKKTLLDFGAGSGFAASVIHAVFFPTTIVYCADNDLRAGYFLRKRELTFEIIKEDWLKSGFNHIQLQYDIILCSHVLEHIENYSEYLKKFAKMAEHLILVVPDGKTGDSDHKHIFNRVSFKQAIDENIEYMRMKYYPLYHPHINNLIAVIDL